MQPSVFPSNTAAPTFFRTYSNLNLDTKEKESVADVFQRTMTGLQDLSGYTTEEYNLIEEYVYSLKTFFSGRWLWVGGKPFVTKQKNFSSAYNCIGMATDSIEDFGRCFNLLMQGCGVGASITLEELALLPSVKRKINLLDITPQEDIGSAAIASDTTVFVTSDSYTTMYVGDSRESWVTAYNYLLATATTFGSEFNLKIDLKQPRKAGTPIKGFGGFANPTDLRALFVETIDMLNSYTDKPWDSFLAAWLYGRVAKCTVAGNIRRSAELMQGSPDDLTFTDMKDNLWSQDSNGKWRIDPVLDPLRMANHTRMFHQKPTEAEVLESVTKQYYSGEGAIGYAPMALVRTNVDLLDTQAKQDVFHALYLVNKELAKNYLLALDPSLTTKELDHRIERHRANPCFRGDMRLLTIDGYKTFAELDGTSPLIINATGQQSQSKVWCSGEKEVFEVKYGDQSIFCTEDHVFLTQQENGLTTQEVKAKDLLGQSLTQYVNLGTESEYSHWVTAPVSSITSIGFDKVYDFTEPLTHWGVVEGLVVHNCFEILGQNFHCDLSEIHLNQLNPLNIKEQEDAFKVGGLIVSGFLKHEFLDEKFRYSREIDPIVGVSITGLFDFFVDLFGVDWLLWWKAGRPDNYEGLSAATIYKWMDSMPDPVAQLVKDWDEHEGQFGRYNDDAMLFKAIEQWYLEFWRDTATNAVWSYCDTHNLRRPNRCTTVQPAGSKSLLTGASCGYHPPKTIRYIRRITFGKNDPIAKACMDYGYTVVPAQKDTDLEGRLLDDPFDPRCTEWLVEIPVEVKWASIADGFDIDPNQFSAEAQFDWFMQVQTHYSAHNTSSTIELREAEIPALSHAIYTAIQENKPYVSTALLSRFDGYESFPRLPFEPVTVDQYTTLVQEVLDRRKSEDFYQLMSQYQTSVEFEADRGSVACESDKCLISR